MIWPLSTSAISYSTLYTTHIHFNFSSNWTLVLGVSVDDKLFT